MNIRKLAALAGASAVFVGACSSSGGGTASGAAPSAGGSAAAGACTVGMSWNNYQEERWAKWDEPALKKAIEDGGGTYISNDAKSSAETQATNVESLISGGAKVLIILAQDDVAIKPSVTKAIGEGIPVIAYDRLIEDPGVLYLTFDNVEVGRMQAREIFKAMPKGNYAIIKGNEADNNSRFLRGGYDEIIGDAVKAGDIKIVGEQFTDGWKPDIAQTNMEGILTANNNKVRRRSLRERRHGGRRHRGAQGPGPRRQGAGVRPGRRPGGAQQRRPRQPDRRASGRTPASSARRPVRQPSRCARTRTSPRSRTPRPSRRPRTTP